MKAKQLEALLHKEIPITQALAIEVLELEPTNIIVKAPFAQNKNIHDTAFAGSIYTTATLAGWSLVTNYLQENNLSGSVVLAKGEVKYLRPIQGDIIAHAQLPDAETIASFNKQLNGKGRARLTLTIDVIEDEKVKAQLVGNFAVV